MRERIKNIPLFRIVTGLFVGFLLLAWLNYVVIHNCTEAITTAGQEIDSAGKTRMLSQKILLLLNLYEEKPSVEDDLLAAMDEHDEILNTFAEGGHLRSIAGRLEIDPVSGHPKLVLNRALALWDSVQSNINILINAPFTVDTTVVRTVLVSSGDSLGTMVPNSSLETIQMDNPARQRASNFLLQQRDKWLKANNQFVIALVDSNDERVSYLNMVLLLFALINTLCIILVLYGCYLYIFKPLEELGNVSDQLESGNLHVRYHYKSNNEIGIITSCLNSLAGNLEQSRDFIKEIAQGNLDKQLIASDEALKNDGIENALLQMRDQMQQRAAEDEQRKWTNEGLSKFVNILRNNNDLKQLCDAMISNLVDYTNSNQAGVYLLTDEETNPRLELISLYAYDTQKFDKKYYRISEGLVGQTFAEGKTTYLLEVPQDYIRITSGLGDTTPNNILLVPLISEDVNYGVLEIASFQVLEEYQIQFVERLMESFASTIASVKVNQKTKVLLEESQQLTEQMQAQEEEMRQNMEELTATQEEMSRKETAMNQQMKAIDNLIAMAEYATDGSVIAANGRFADLAGIDQRAVMSKSFSDLHDDTMPFVTVMSGEPWKGESLKNSATSSETLISQMSPIMDEGGEVTRVVEIVTEAERVAVESSSELDEVELALRQNLEELEITQEQLNRKLTDTTSVVQALEQTVPFFTVDATGVIKKMSDKARSVVGNATNLDNLGATPDMLSNKEIKLNDSKNNSLSAKVLLLPHANHEYLIIWN